MSSFELHPECLSEDDVSRASAVPRSDRALHVARAHTFRVAHMRAQALWRRRTRVPEPDPLDMPKIALPGGGEPFAF